MTCSSLRIAALLLAGAAAAEEPKDTAIFTSPLATVGSLGFSSLNRSNAYVYVPLGAVFTAGDFDWTVDVAFIHVAPPPTPAGGFLEGFTGFWFGAGPTIHSGDLPLHGALFTPKIIVGGFQVTNGETMIDFLLGFDFGYQFTVGRMYVGVVLGLSVGVGFSDNDGFAGPWQNVRHLSTDIGTTHPVFGLNLDLARLGPTF